MTRPDIVRDFGQMFVMAFDGPRLPSDVAEFLRTFRIGGVILFADNYESPSQLKRLTAELQSRCSTEGTPLFVATDHEGGRVQRFKAEFEEIKPQCEFGVAPVELVEEVHRRIARELKAVGVNINLAPVADLCERDSPGAIGDRSFGSDPQTVAARAAAAVRGLQGEGVFACVKHFPGHGATTQDSHRELPVVTLPHEEMEERDLLPFKVAIAAGVRAVMTAHAVYPSSGDSRWPASLSHYWLTRVLRRRMNFQGLIITDAIEMKALLSRWSPTECGHHAIRAGADILIYYKEAHQFEAFYNLRRALERGELNPSHIARRLERIRRAKQLISQQT